MAAADGCGDGHCSGTGCGLPDLPTTAARTADHASVPDRFSPVVADAERKSEGPRQGNCGQSQGTRPPASDDVRPRLVPAASADHDPAGSVVARTEPVEGPR